MKGSCETCAFYEYDEEYDYYVCSASLDEDEMARFLQDSHFACPYYRLGEGVGTSDWWSSPRSSRQMILPFCSRKAPASS